MGYDGHIQMLCKRGHYEEVDEWAFQHGDGAECEVCGEPFVWYNSVDDTNCDAVGEVLMQPYLLHAEEREERCESLPDGRLRRVISITPAVYSIPPEDAPQYHWVSDGQHPAGGTWELLERR